MHKYGLTMKAYEELIYLANGKCMICSDLVRLELDHDHEIGRARGLLCRRCNQGIGHFADSIILLRKAIEYLQDPPAYKIKPEKAQPVYDWKPPEKISG